uniref:FERM domain-containing protein n=1 Tax=Caenorhabditis japonica TaxID=281687 RepID=A0A8R1IQW9_CAEJA
MIVGGGWKPSCENVTAELEGGVVSCVIVDNSEQKGKDREPVDQQHHPPPATSPAPSQHPRNPKMQAARVRLPVGVYKEFEVNRGSEGEALFRQVTSDLSIEERDYFSLCFYDKEEGIRHWLYNDKKILKQLKSWLLFFLTFPRSSLSRSNSTRPHPPLLSTITHDTTSSSNSAVTFSQDAFQPPPTLMPFTALLLLR